MTFSVLFVERRDPESSSLERVFRTVGEVLSSWGIRVSYKNLSYGNSMLGMALNTLASKPPPADIYHITGHIHYYALLLPSKNTVLTIHDLQVLKVRRGLRRYLIKKIFYDLPVKRLWYITTISEKTKRDLVETINCPDEKIVVIEDPLTVSRAEFHPPFDRDCPVILHIGTAPHKNLANLIVAVAKIRCRLTIIGPLDMNMRKMLSEHNIAFENKRDLSAAEMCAEYRNSDIVSFCSIAEGFGLPIIEAQAMRVPVITSNLSPMKDVAGGGAVLADPNDPASIKRGIEKIIDNDDFRRRIVEKGLLNIDRFTPEIIAGRYLDLYTTILKNKDPGSECGRNELKPDPMGGLDQNK